MSSNLFLRRLAAGLSLIGLLSPLVPASAATITSPSLLKGPGDAVYYLGTDNRRYVFPTANTYKTWYADFSQVQTVTIGDLAAYPIGGNVTYRPGVKLVKITTDPRVYAVESGGVLRWVKTEAVAQALYGMDWNKKIDDIPDTFFINYTMGHDIVNASDFSPSAVMNASGNIDQDLAIRRQINPSSAPTTPPGPTTPPSSKPTSTPPVAGGDFTFTISKTHIQGGDTVLLSGAASSSVNVQKIELIADGQQVKLCQNFPTCTGEFTIPLSGTKEAYTFEGRLTKLDASVESQVIRMNISSNGSNLVKLSVGQASITPGQLASALVDISPEIAIIRVDLSVGGNVIKSCADGARQCRWADYLQGGIGTDYPVFAKVTDSLGRIYTSKTLHIIISNNDSPGITISASKSTAYTGETFDVTVTASDNDGIASMDVISDGVTIKHCDSPAPCTATAGPFSSIGDHEFTGHAMDTKQMSATSEPITVTVTTQP